MHENKRAIVVQQEVLTDVRSFNRALIHVLRQDPDVIVVGEMRDYEAIATALTAAETGHLVLATMHSPNVSHALERIIGVFEGSAQRQIIMQMANSLQGIIAQDLLAATDRSRRVLAFELLIANGAVRNMIRENQFHQLENMIQMGRKEGMVLMDNCLYDLYLQVPHLLRHGREPGAQSGTHPARRQMRTLAAILVLLTGWRAGAAPLDADIARFITAKSNQVYLASRDSETPVPPEVWNMFTAASAADWKGTSNIFRGIYSNNLSSTPRRLAPEVWGRVQDVGGFCELISSNNLKFIRLFADEIFKVVPPGGVYFGGTDAGRFALTALSRAHEEGKPFFTLTQNQLVDNDYLKYVKSIYHQWIKFPDDAMVKGAFDDYVADVTRRSEHDRRYPNEPKQVLPGEDIQTVNGRLQISGQTAVMAINGLLVRDILHANPERDFYIEESFALDWMYPCLEPAGPIFKLRHTPMETLFEETMRNDREYLAAADAAADRGGSPR